MESIKTVDNGYSRLYIGGQSVGAGLRCDRGWRV